MKKTFFKNSFTSLFLEIVVFIVGFFVPKLIIDIYGSEVHGLSTSIIQILSIIQLIQAGAVGASIYSLLKPIHDNDQKEIAIIYKSSVKYYKKTSYLYLAISFVVALASPLFIKVDTIENSVIISSFFIFMTVGFLQFFYISKYDTLLSSHQKRYMLTIANIIEKLFYYALLFTVLFFKLPFLLMYVSFLIGAMIKTVFLSLVIKKYYHNIVDFNIQDNELKPINNKNDIMITSIIFNLIYSLPVITISIFWGLSYTSIFGVYNMISGVLSMILNVIFYSSIELVSSRVVKSNGDDIRDTFRNVNTLYYFITTIMVIPCFFLINQFVDLYIGNDATINYNRPLLGYSIAFNIIFFMKYLILRSVLQSFGLFKEQRLAIIYSFIVSLPFYIILPLLDFDYTAIGFSTFSLSFSLFSVTILKRKGFMFMILLYEPITYTVILSGILSLGFISTAISPLNISNYREWVNYGFVITTFAIIISGLIIITLTKGEVIRVVISIIRKTILTKRR